VVIDRVSDTLIDVGLPLHKARLVRLPVDVRDVLASNSSVADIILKTPRLAYLIGNNIGTTNVIFLDANGQQIARLDVVVGVDLGALGNTLHALIPDEDFELVALSDNVALTGTVSTPEVAASIQEIALQYVPGDSIVNMLRVRNEQQVLLKVRFAEVNRQAVKEFGFDTNISIDTGDFLFGLASGLGPTASTFGSVTGVYTGSNTFDTTINALEQNNLVRILAEPTVTSISGEPASVLVGGEFPIPVPGQNNSVTIEFKTFGVILEFTPVVLSDQRISLRVNAEVSATTQENAIFVEGFNVPSLITRRANTSVDLPSGDSLVIAGLLQNNMNATIQGLPGLMNIPILGTLFRSTSFQRDETELVVLVTPYLVRPIAETGAAYPTDGLAPASDLEMYLLGRIHAVYADRRPTPSGDEIAGPIGFIVE
jgi:pilus assembly protein CpaC